MITNIHSSNYRPQTFSAPSEEEVTAFSTMVDTPMASIAAALVHRTSEQVEAMDALAEYDSLAQSEANDRRVQSLHEQAAATMEQGLVGGLFQVASGALSVGGGIASLGKLSGATGEVAAASASAAQNAWSGAASVCGGAGQVATGFFSADIKRSEAAGQAAAGDAERAGSRSSSATESARRASETSAHLLDAVRTLSELETQSKRAVIWKG